MFRVCHSLLSVHCSLVVTCQERVGLLALLYVMCYDKYCFLYTFPCGVLGWCGTWLYRFMVFDFFLTFFSRVLLHILCFLWWLPWAHFRLSNAIVVERKYFTSPSRESNQSRLIYRQTLYHVAVKVGFYRKAVEVCYIPIPSRYNFPISGQRHNVWVFNYSGGGGGGGGES